MEQRSRAFTQGLSRRFGAASKSLDDFGSKVDKFGSRMSSLAVPVGIAAGAVGLVGANIIQAGAEFEAAISAVGAVGLQTKQQIADLEAEALRLGAATQFTATQSANAMEVMARAGFKNSEILAGVGPILSAAAASGLEIAEVANHVSNALKGMGLEASEAARVSDVLALASSKTNSSIGSLGESLSNVSSTARQFNIPLEDTVAAVALLQDVGLDASVAGSALNVMLTQMAAPTDGIAKKMKQFGVTFKDAEGNMLPFQDVLANIAKASKASGGNMDQVAFLAELVGLRGQKAAANLKDLFNSGKVGELTEQLYKAGGAAEKMSKLRMDNLNGDIELLNSAVDGIKISIFGLNSGPMRGIIQATNNWVTANEDVIATKIGDFVQGLIRSLPTMIDWMKRIGIGVGIFMSVKVAIAATQAALDLAKGAVWAYELAVKGAAGSVRGMAAAKMIFTDKAKAAEKAMAAFNAVAAVNPMVWIFGGIAALVLLITYWDEATNAVARYIDKVEGWFSDEAKQKNDHKQKLIEKGLLLESDDRSGIDGAERAGDIDTILKQILADSDRINKQIEAATQRGVDASKNGTPIEGTEGDSGASAAPAPLTAQAEVDAALGYRGGDPFDFGGQVHNPRKPEADTMEITVRAEAGTAEVTQPPKSPRKKVKMKETGAY